MRTIPRNATKVISGIRETCTVFNLFVEVDGTWTRVPTSSGRDMELAFETLAGNKEARLVEFEAGKSYGITFGDTRWTRQRHMITLTVPATVSAGMQGVTYQPDHGELTVPVNVHRVFVHLDDQGEPVTMAEVDHDGLGVTTEADKLSPEPWVWVPSAEYLAEQAAIEAAAEHADQEQANESASAELSPTMETALNKLRTDGVIYMGNGVSLATVRALESHGLATVEVSVHADWNRRSGRNHSTRDWTAWPTRTALVTGRRENAARADQERAEETKPEIMRVGFDLVTVVKRASLKDGSDVVLFSHTMTRDRVRYGAASITPGSLPSILAWAESDSSADRRFQEWVTTVENAQTDNAGNSAETEPVTTSGIPLAYIPMHCVCVWWIPEGSETAYHQKVKPECTVHSPESHQEESAAPGGVVLTESAERELRELVTAWRLAANPTREWEIGMDLVVAVEALLEQEGPTA